MENFFGSNEDVNLRKIPIDDKSKSIVKPDPPRFFDDEDVPDPK